MYLMDPVQARVMAGELSGNEVGGWLSKELIDSGRSALVLKAEKADRVVAIKVFDRELVQRCGAAAQLEQIRRQLAPCGKHHGRLTGMLDGGYCGKLDVYFVVMRYFSGTTLEKACGKIPYEGTRARARSMGRQADL